MPDYNGLTRNQWPGTWSPSSSHPIVLDTEMRGGLRYVSGSVGDRLSNITGQRLQDGMIVYVENGYTENLTTYEGGKYYKYTVLPSESRNASTGELPNDSANWGLFSTSDISEGTNQYYTTAKADSDARSALVGFQAGGDGSFSYDSATGIFTYTGPNEDEVRAHFTANKGLSLTSGEFNIDSANVKGMFAGDKGLAYNSTTGVFDIDSANVRGMFSGSNSLDYNSSTGDIRAPQPLDSAANPTFNQLRGPANFIIDPATIGDATGTVQILGNLQVDGTTTTINSTNVSIDDKTFTLADNASDSSALNGGGIIWGGASITANKPSFLYNHASERFDANRIINATSFVGNVTGDLTGNAATATKLATGRTIDVTGVTATGQTFDGQSNIDIEVTDVPASLLSGTININRLPNIDSTRIPPLAASDITSEVFDSARVPAIQIDANRITSGTIDNARISLDANEIPSLATSKITSGVFDSARIPPLAASDITSEVFDSARIPDIPATFVTVSSNNTADETVFLTFVDGMNGSQGLETDHSLKYNPSHNRLDLGAGAGTFSINSQGSLINAGGAIHLQASGTTADDHVELNHGGGTSGKRLVTTDSGVTVTGSLIADSATLTNLTVSGTIDGEATLATTAGTATNVTAVANNSTDESVFITFVDGATGSQGIETDTHLTYNPGTNTLSLGAGGDALTIDDAGEIKANGNTLTLNSTSATAIQHRNNTKLNTTKYGVTVTGTVNADSATLTGNITAASLDISGNVDVDGTLEADAITVDGDALATVIAGTTVTTAVNATNAANIAVADESTDTTCFPLFVTSNTGNEPAKVGSNLTFNSSTGVLSATKFSGNGSQLSQLDASEISSGTISNDRISLTAGDIPDLAASKITSGVFDSARIPTAYTRTHEFNAGSAAYDPSSTGAGTDTTTTAAISLADGMQIVGHTAGYIRNLIKFNASAPLEIGQGNTAFIREVQIKGGSGHGVELYDKNIKRLETTDSGVLVTGQLVADSATLTGDLKVDDGDLILGQGAYSISSDFVGLKAANQSGSQDYMIISGVTGGDGSTYISAKSGGSVNIRAGGNDANHALRVTSSYALANGDFAFDSPNAVFFDNSSQKLSFGDVHRLTFGTDSDLKIYHDGSNSYIADEGTGNLNIKSTFANIFGAGGTSATFYPGNSVDLYYNNIKRFETTPYGVTVTGTVNADSATFNDTIRINGDGNKGLIIGDEALSSSNDYVGMKTTNMTGTSDYMILSGLETATMTDATFISAKSGNNVFIRGGGNNTAHQIEVSASIAKAHGNFEVTGTLNGHTIPSGAGTLALTSDISGGGGGLDSDNLTNGTFTNMQVDSATFNILRIPDHSGNTVPQPVGNRLTFGDDSDFRMYFSVPGNVSVIEHAGSGSLNITSTGQFYLNDATNSDTWIRAIPNDRVEINYQDHTKLKTQSYGVNVNGRVQADSAHFSKAASDAEFMTTLYGVRVTGIVDADSATFTGNVTGSTFTSNVADGTAPFEVTSTTKVDNLNADFLDGITQSSFVRSDQTDIKTFGDLTFNDNVKAKFGTGGDLEIYHNANINRIEAAQSLYLKGTKINFYKAGQSELMASFQQDSSVSLYYDAAKKFETTAYGATVTGQLVADSATINGGSIFFDSAGNSERLQLTHELRQSSDVLKIQTATGFTRIGPQNTGFSHFETDRAKFWFGSRVMLGENHLTSYNGDLILSNQENATHRVIISDSDVQIHNGVLRIDQDTAPSITANKLYNVGGSLFWNGTDVTSGGGGTATDITISANNSTNETVFPTFVDGATGTQGLETDTGLTYNPDTGRLTAVSFFAPTFQHNGGTVTVNASEGKVVLTHQGSTKLETSSSGIDVNGSVTVGSGDTFVLDGSETTTSSTSQTALVTVTKATYGAAKFLVTAVSSSERHITEIYATHDGTTGVATEYGTVTTNGILATYDVDINGDNFRLLATPASSTSTTFKVVQTLIEA